MYIQYLTDHARQEALVEFYQESSSLEPFAALVVSEDNQRRELHFATSESGVVAVDLDDFLKSLELARTQLGI